MRNAMKVARWELKRNLKNKSFIIGLFLTPAIFALFMIVPSLFNSDEEGVDDVHLFVTDELNVYEALEDIVADADWDHVIIEETDLDRDTILKNVVEEPGTAYLEISEEYMEAGEIPLYVHDEIEETFMFQVNMLEEPIRDIQLDRLGLSDQEIEIISRGVAFDVTYADDLDEETTSEDHAASLEDDVFSGEDPLERIVPGAFAGIILFSIVMSGMMVFQSASQEKKEKIAEIILSSLTPNELMQGKIIGYFVLGLIQVFVWIGLAIPLVMWKFDLALFDYLFVPELIILLAIAVLGYLLFAALFVGLGATMEDVSTSGNFQGMVLMLPFLPLILIGPIIDNPSGLIAQIGSYIPFTSPAILIMRLTMLETWPWVEIAIGSGILLISVWVFMKLAGKIFQVGILMYGKNATPREIWRWLRM